MWGRGFYGNPGGVDWVGSVVMMFFGLLVLVGIVLLVVWLVRALAGDRMHAPYGHRRYGGPGPEMRTGGPGYGYGQPPRVDSAMAAARERYARGEITAEQLDEITRNLGYGQQQAAPPQQPSQPPR